MFRIILLLWLLPLSVWAHKASDSYLTLDLTTTPISGQWSIALRDLETAVGLDSNYDGAITWGEVRRQHHAIADYALNHLQVYSGGQACQLLPAAQLVDQLSDGAYTVLPFNADCSANSELSLRYGLLFTLDPSHRGLLRVIYPESEFSAVFSPDQPELILPARQPNNWQTVRDYWQEGVWHIWLGFDHVLFLLALLLPSVLWYQQGHWHYAHSLRRVLYDVAAIVTAFTLAHSITLSAAVLGWVSLPSRWVESVIALSVVLAALNNLWPVLRSKRWLIAFGLGLIHGFGFASVLTDLGLPTEALLLALLAFNLGVESGQLAIVTVFVPLAYLLRQHWLYRRAILQAGSLLIALLACGWFWQRLA